LDHIWKKLHILVAKNKLAAMNIEIKQIAGYESIILILLLIFWASYRYWKSAKSGELAAEMEGDEEMAEGYDFQDDPEKPVPEAFLDAETSIYQQQVSAPIAASIKETSVEVEQDPVLENSDISDFDPRKAVIWAEVLKRPYC